MIANNFLDFSIVLFFICPIFIFLCLKNKFKKLDINNLFLFSLIIFILPSVRSAAVWPNTQITAIIFFLISLLFFIKWENRKQFNKINKELFLTVFFMSLTVYTRQLYAMIFFYFMVIFFMNLNKKVFLQTVIIVVMFALPGVLFLLFWPKILQATFAFKLHNSLLVNSSIISFYLIPFFTILFLFEKNINFKFNKWFELFLIISFVLICISFFDYNYLLGGGFFIKLSKIFFNNFYFFYLTSIIGLFLLYYLCLEDKLNLFLSLIILLSISAYIIFMKYYEPMFIILLFLLFKTRFTALFLKKKKYIYFYLLYFLTYLSSAIINSFLLLSKNI